MVPLSLQGKSMAPFLSEGDEVTWVPLGRNIPAQGDIITFSANGLIVVHRVVRIRRRDGRVEIREKGDAQRLGRWMEAEDVLGRVVSIHRGGRVRDLTKAPWPQINRLLGLLHGILDMAVEWRQKLRRSISKAG